MNSKIIKLFYICLFILICIAPLALIKLFGMQDSAENKTKMPVPEIADSDGLNTKYLSELGAWFEENFAFRNELVSLNGRLMSDIFGVSPEDKIIVGKDGWLYATVTLDDYLGRNVFSERKLNNIAHNLYLIQKRVESGGRRFVFTSPVNKNTLYGDNMPYYYKPYGNSSNLDNLKNKLTEKNVNYVDLKELFKQQDETLYLKRDSHWNGEGALLSYNSIMDELDHPHNTYATGEKSVDKSYIGDLSKMIYPELAKGEENQSYLPIFSYEYIGEGKSVEDFSVTTASVSGSSSLLMYRDSFSNTLIPLMAGEFAYAHFTKYVPYFLERDLELYDPETVVIELVERNLINLAKQAPVLESPILDNFKVTSSADSSSEIKCQLMNGMYLISGKADEKYVDDDCEIYLRLTDVNGKVKTYNTFNISYDDTDFGFEAYIRQENMPKGELKAEIIIKNGKDLKSIKTVNKNFKDDNGITEYSDTDSYSGNISIKLNSENEFKKLGSVDKGEQLFIYNRTGKDITNICIKKSGETEWGKYIFNKGENIEKNEKAEIYAGFSRESKSTYDIKFVFSDSGQKVLYDTEIFDMGSISVFDANDYLYSEYLSISNAQYLNTDQQQKKKWQDAVNQQKEQLEEQERLDAEREAEEQRLREEKEQQEAERLLLEQQDLEQQQAQQETSQPTDYSNTIPPSTEPPTQPTTTVEAPPETVQTTTSGESNQRVDGCINPDDFAGLFEPKN